MFGRKSWDFNVKNALRISLEDNLDMISDTIEYTSKKLDEVMFDVNIFDGFKSNPKYVIETIRTAYKSGADWIILCDTNGGTYV